MRLLSRKPRLGPVKILGAEPAEDGTTVKLGDGREFGDVNVIIPEEQVEQIRQGYRCIRCMEPQSTAFPVVCEATLPDGVTHWCNFPIRRLQAEEFAIMFKGTVHVGSRIDKADELERMREMDEYEERTGLVLPDHVKFPTSSV